MIFFNLLNFSNLGETAPHWASQFLETFCDGLTILQPQLNYCPIYSRGQDPSALIVPGPGGQVTR